MKRYVVNGGAKFGYDVLDTKTGITMAFCKFGGHADRLAKLLNEGAAVDVRTRDTGRCVRPEVGNRKG